MSEDIFLIASLIGAVLLFLIYRLMFAGQAAAAKVVAQQHLLASDALVAGIVEHATHAGKLQQALQLLEEARQKQGDGTVRVGHVAWVLLTLDGGVSEPAPKY